MLSLNEARDSSTISRAGAPRGPLAAPAIAESAGPKQTLCADHRMGLRTVGQRSRTAHHQRVPAVASQGFMLAMVCAGAESAFRACCSPSSSSSGGASAPAAGAAGSSQSSPRRRGAQEQDFTSAEARGLVLGSFPHSSPMAPRPCPGRRSRRTSSDHGSAHWDRR